MATKTDPVMADTPEDVNTIDDMSYERKLVVAHMHRRGVKSDVLTNDEWLYLYNNLADGFGPFAPRFYDWSHVRDSSEEAMKRMAAKIKRMRLDKKMGAEPNFHGRIIFGINEEMPDMPLK